MADDLGAGEQDPLDVVPAPADLDLFTCDAALGEALRRHGGEHHAARLRDLGRLAGSARTARWAATVDRHPPQIIPYDPYGQRVDELERHPSWHRLLQAGVKAGLGATPWLRPPDERPHLGRAASVVVWAQTETAHLGVLSTTYAAIPAVRAEPPVSAVWTPRLGSPAYEAAERAPQAKLGCLASFAVTEQQAGADLRAVTTVARPAPGGPLEGTATYRLTGRKAFVSTPDTDVLLVLAAAPGGPTAFLVPRVLPDGTRNGIRLVRLRPTVGHRAAALAELDLEGAWGVRLGDEGRGLRTFLGPMSAARLDAALTSAGIMRAALVRAVHHARGRRAFGSTLADKPLMANVLADLAVESEAATTVVLRLAAAVDAGERDLLRVAVPVVKYWVCKRSVQVVTEAAECLGGNGWVEDHGTARLLRDAAGPALWEGTGSTAALDVLRAASLQPRVMEVLLDEVDRARGADPRLDRAMDEVADYLQAAAREARRDPGAVEAGARWLVERLAVVLQASLLVRSAPAPVASAFLATRVAFAGGVTFGTLPVGRQTTRTIVDRALPC